MVQTQIELTEEQIEKLGRLAQTRQVSLSELLREGVDLLLQEDVSHEELRKRALAISGRFRSGLKDLAKRHDDYLAEAIQE